MGMFLHTAQGKIPLGGGNYNKIQERVENLENIIENQAEQIEKISAKMQSKPISISIDKAHASNIYGDRYAYGDIGIVGLDVYIESVDTWALNRIAVLNFAPVKNMSLRAVTSLDKSVIIEIHTDGEVLINPSGSTGPFNFRVQAIIKGKFIS